MDLTQAAGAALAEAPPVLSWALSVLGTAALLLPPAVTAVLGGLYFPKNRWLAAGLVFGLVCYPLSYWFYLHHFMDPVRSAVLGTLGVALVRWHCLPFFWLPSLDAETGRALHWYVSRPVLAPFVWGAFYALLGALADRLRRSKTEPPVRV